MTTSTERGLTKLTAKLYAPMYADFERQVSDALLRRDAFLDRMIQQEIPYLREDLKGKKLSPEANRYISRSLKGLGGRDTPELRQVSIAVKHETADALRAVVEEHNLVRDAFLNRLIALLRSSDKLLDSLGLPKKISSFRRDGTEDMPTSPMRTIREVLDDPFFYLRHECEMQHGHGLNLLEFPEQLHGLCCYLPDDRVSGTQAHEERRRREEENLNLAYLLDDLESNLTHVQQHPKGA